MKLKNILTITVKSATFPTMTTHHAPPEAHKITRREFRKHLNEMFRGKNWSNGRYGQRAREYGDYLWFQDRDKFEMEYAEAARPATH